MLKTLVYSDFYGENLYAEKDLFTHGIFGSGIPQHSLNEDFPILLIISKRLEKMFIASHY
jgi:hypothetical protein